MTTYTSLFKSLPRNIIDQKEMSDFTPYSYGNIKTKYAKNSSSIYTNSARFEVNYLESYTPYMIIITATN